ncbi:MAG: rhomboid family intramembrane serine protease [Arenibacterium sp.]
MFVEWPRQPASVRHFVLVCVAIEVLATLGFLLNPSDGIRTLLIYFGGFWPSLMDGHPGALPGQVVYMFATSAFIHGGWLHLAMNMFALMWLGPIIVRRAGRAAFWPLSGLSALGAGAGYALLSNSGAPMVGASGVIFGLLGAVACWTVLDQLARRASLRPLMQQALVLLVLNVALTLLSDGSIAWQAHLGGFIAGAICGALSWRHLTSGPLKRL